MQHLQYDSQLEWKQKTVEQLMKRYIDEGAKLYQIVGMVEPWRYRNKCHISFGMNGRRQIISGIYEENSHRVVPVESCPDSGQQGGRDCALGASHHEGVQAAAL